jgi:alpha-beta hydrolase superfamily lysophospholipase
MSHDQGYQPVEVEEKPRRTWKRIRKFCLLACLLVSVIFAGVAWYIGGQLVSPANRIVGDPPEDIPAESYEIESESGSTLAAWFVSNEQANSTLILLHPIRGNRRSMLERAKLFYEQGFSILMIDLQAHGESPGENITIGFREKHDVVAAVEFAKRKNPNHKIGIVGRSLGGAAALLASPLDVDAIVIESVYPTIAGAVYNRVGMRLGPAKYLVGPALLWQLEPRLGISVSDLKPIDYIGKVDCPILVASGDRDRHTTIRETQLLFEMANQPKQLTVFAGAEHEDLLEFDRELYVSEILAFLTLCLED